MREGLEALLRRIGGELLDLRERTSRSQSSVIERKRRGDRVAQRILVENLPGIYRRPILSEEQPNIHAVDRPDEYWLIDPVDGTASFAEGYDGFVIQAALVRRGIVEVAAIYAPAFEDFYYGQRSSATYRNNQELETLNQGSEIRSLIDNTTSPEGVAAELIDDFEIDSYIECGSISLKILRVAEGNADLFVKDVVVRDWDVAAPKLILEEVGGALSDGSGSSFDLRGSMSKEGLIAARSDAILTAVADWMVRRHNRG